ncbi:MAG: MoxR family ATPase [Sphingomonadales bacterium]|nr:MoxR family ATPase [Sphingomonadales bacterium]
MKLNYTSDREAVDGLSALYREFSTEAAKVVVGQTQAVQSVWMALLANGHCFLVGVPGLAKTTLVQTISSVLDLSFNRIQFTPDLMPGDITGSEILDQNRAFKFIPGPLFANMVLADEINRTPPKTQSALLEAMQERQLTVGGQTHCLPSPFFVLATQNPIEQEGTYPLPEAQLDRFMFQIRMQYPSLSEEIQVVRQTTSSIPAAPNKVMDGETLLFFQQLIRRIPVTDHVLEYAVQLAASTRPGSEQARDFTKDLVQWGAGPRASQYLVLGAKCHAATHGKYSPDIEDVKAVAHEVLAHRMVLNYKAEAQGLHADDLITRLL